MCATRNKKVLLLVPHPDDEVNIGGGLFDQLKAKGYEVTVLFSTYGDYIPNLAPVRLKEIVQAQKSLNYDNIIFLGYGDDYIDSHLYDRSANEIATSVAGKCQTYNVENFSSYHYYKYGSQTHYTRNNYKKDIKDVILFYRADILICVDIDKHVEHKCLSLIFDEVIGEIIKESDYRPFIFKKFAYIGVYDSIRDYFKRPMVETLPSVKGKMTNEAIVYPYVWNERMIVQNNVVNYPLAFWRSPIFKALLAHRSQRAALRFVQICNKDVIFWERRTDNLVLNADISATSGNVKYLNDFKIVDFDTIRTDSWDVGRNRSKAWIPYKEDNNPEIIIKLRTPVIIDEFVIHQTKESQIDSVDVLLDGKLENSYVAIKSYCMRIKNKNTSPVSVVTLKFKKINHLALNEIEIFEHRNVCRYLPFNFEIYPDKKEACGFLYLGLYRLFSLLYMKKDINLLIKALRIIKWKTPKFL